VALDHVTAIVTDGYRTERDLVAVVAVVAWGAGGGEHAAGAPALVGRSRRQAPEPTPIK